MIAVTRELCGLAPAVAFARAGNDDLVWLDSGVGDEERGVISRLVLECEPVPVDLSDTHELWTRADSAFQSDAAAGGIGWVGYVAYDAAPSADASIRPRARHDAWPPIAFRRVRACLEWSRGIPDPVLRCCGPSSLEAAWLCEQWIARLATPDSPKQATDPMISRIILPEREATQRAVATVIDAIHRGQIFQGCFTFPIRVETGAPLGEIYLALRDRSAGDFGVYLRMAEVELASVSPERLCQVRADRQVRARPMKGTRKRTDPRADRAVADELRSSEKDRSENVMIVDLLRNDLGRVCVPGSVRVPELFAVETYATVLQMTSTVSGELREGVGPFGLLRAVFPPGSMTGAPKVEACNLLTELEAESRGLYSGSVAWLGFDGDWAFNVLIRTLQQLPDNDGHRALTWWVGGGIVADSTPADEWEEAMAKAAPLFALGRFNPDS
jgi:anthranilate/para-aminobenzoate synthase component I